jgi:geranylgeranyl diphosphate synthase type II
MLILSYQLIEKIPVEFQPEIYKEFNKMALWLCEGQQDDMDFEETETVSTEEYLEMIKNKTSVLIGFCLKSGAIFGKSSETVKQKIYDFGINLGLAFQLQDDYLDLYPKSIKMGKTIGGDLLNKKKSIPYLIAINQGNEQDIYNIKKLINSEVKHRVDELISIFETINVKEKTEEIIANYFEKAKQNLAGITEFDTKSLYNFAEMLMAREN